MGSTCAARHQSMNSLVPNRLVSVENQARSSRVGRAATRANAVLPVVAGDKIAAGIAHNRGPQLLDEGEDVAAKAFFVGGRMARLVDAAVNAAPQMLNKGPEQPGVGIADGKVAIEKDFGVAHDGLSLEPQWCGQ